MTDEATYSVNLRACGHGAVWMDVERDGAVVVSVGFTVENALEFSDDLIVTIGEALEIVKAHNPVGNA